MRRQKTLISIFFFSLLVFGFGCKTSATELAASVRPVTINYWTVFDNVAELKKRAADYKAIYPNVTVNIKQVRYEEFDRLFINALADDVQPDIVSIHTRWLKKYEPRLSPMLESTKMGRLVQTGTITKDTAVVTDINNLPTLKNLQDDYVSAVAEDVVRGGKIYGLPLAIDTLGVFYNQALLDKGGIAQPPENWDDFSTAVKAITKLDKDGKIIQSGVALGTGKNIDNSFDIISAIMQQNGVTMASKGSVGFAGGLDKKPLPTHPSLQALGFYTNFARPTTDLYSWNEEQTNAFDGFIRGKVAFYFGFGYEYNRIVSRAPDLKLGVLPLFQVDANKKANVVNYWLEAVTKKAKNKNEAWDFVRFLSTPENLKKYSDATKQLSPLRMHLKAEQADPIMKAFADQLLIAKNWYKGDDIDATQKAFSDMVHILLISDPTLDERKLTERNANAILRAATITSQTF